MTATAPARRIEREDSSVAYGGMLYLRLPAPNAGHRVEILYGDDSATGDVRARPTVGIRFRDLAKWWHSDTDGSSFDRDIYEHPAYLAIVEELGEDAIPHMLADLRDNDGHWFEALRQLTGDRSVDARCDGNMRRARALWLRWGASRKLI